MNIQGTLEKNYIRATSKGKTNDGNVINETRRHSFRLSHNRIYDRRVVVLNSGTSSVTSFSENTLLRPKQIKREGPPLELT